MGPYITHIVSLLGYEIFANVIIPCSVYDKILEFSCRTQYVMRSLAGQDRVILSPAKESQFLVRL